MAESTILCRLRRIEHNGWTASNMAIDNWTLSYKNSKKSVLKNCSILKGNIWRRSQSGM